MNAVLKTIEYFTKFSFRHLDLNNNFFVHVLNSHQNLLTWIYIALIAANIHYDSYFALHYNLLIV